MTRPRMTEFAHPCYHTRTMARKATTPATGAAVPLPKLPVTDASVPKLKQYVEKAGTEQAVAALSTSGLLERAVAKGAGALLDSLLQLGVDVDGRPEEDVMWVFDNPGALTRLVLGVTAFEGDAIGEWFARLLAAGARPEQLHPDIRIVNPAHRERAYSACDYAVMAGRLDLLAPMLARVEDPETRASVMVAALRAVPTSVVHSELSPRDKVSAGVLYAGGYLRRDDFVRLLELGLPRVGTSRWGLPVPHAAVLASDPEVFELLVVGHPDALHATAPAPVLVKDANFPAGQVLNLAAGATLADIAAAALGLLRTSRDADLQRGQSGRWVEALQARVAGLERIAGRLRELGVQAGAGAPTVAPEHRPIHDALSAWVGEARVRAALATLATDTTPWLYLWRLAEALGPALRDRLEPAADTHVLAHILCGRHGAAPRPLDLADWRSFGAEAPDKFEKVDPADYSGPAAAVLRAGRLLGRRGDALLCTSELNGGHLWEIWRDRHVDHGDTATLVTSLDRLVIAA